MKKMSFTQLLLGSSGSWEIHEKLAAIVFVVRWLPLEYL